MHKKDDAMEFYSSHTFGLLLVFIIIYFSIHSDYMVSVQLAKIPGATIGNYTTTYGTLLQGAMTISLYLIALIIGSLL